jgi:hypothetical protein
VAGAIPRYFLSATSVPPPASEAEPNGAPEQANAMESVALLGEGMARGTIDPSGDLDLFRFSATPGLAYVIEALARCDPAARLTLYDSDGTTVLGSDSGGVGHCPKFAWQRPNSDFPDPVDSFVGVSGQSGATLSYTLLVWQGYLYGHWETEPNDTGPSDAIAPGERWSGSIGPGTDRDLFGLSGPAGTALTFETFGFGGPGTCGFDTKLEVLGPDGTTLLASDDDGGEGSCSLLQWTVPDAQGYSLAVSSADGEPIPLYVLEVR